MKPPRLAPLPQRLIETLRKPLHRLRPEKRLPVDEERWSTRHSQTERKSKILLDRLPQHRIRQINSELVRIQPDRGSHLHQLSRDAPAARHTSEDSYKASW